MKSRFIWPLVFLFALRLAAQDVMVTGLSWVDPKDPPDTLPVAKISTPDYPERLRGSTEIDYMVVELFLDQKGKQFGVPRFATNPLLSKELDSSAWRFKPARRDGEPVNSLVRLAIIYNPACSGKSRSDATPRLLNLVSPELPRELTDKYTSPPAIYVTVNVDAEGHVTKAVADAGTPDALGQLAEDAVLKWTFAAARKSGQPVVQDVRVPVLFLAPIRFDEKADLPPRVVHQSAPIYPMALRQAGLRGEVDVQFVVDIEGRVRNPVVISSTNPALDQAAIDAILKWKFEPGKRNGIPVNVRMEQPIVFEMDEPGGGYEPYDVKDNTDQSKLPPELRFDIPPKPANTVFAVYPFELLRDKVDGSAEIKFLIAPDGSVAQSTVVNATRPEFGQAAIAMIDEWKFQPAMKDGKPTWALMNMKQKFSRTTMSNMLSSASTSWALPKTDVPVTDSALDLLQELRKEKPDFCPLSELDARPELLSRPPLVFPSTLLGKVEKGGAVIEFLIDRDGNVQLPRIVSATDPAFGYAAVQGVSAWKFVPPTSHGKRVVVRAQIPVRFSAPAPNPASAAAEPAKN